MALGLVAGLGAFTFHHAEGLSYVSDDPRACANCHVMRDYLDSRQKSSRHRRAACNDCHTPHPPLPKPWTNKAQNGWNHSSKFTPQSFPENLRITPGNARRLEHHCVGRHEERVGEILPAQGVGHGDLHCVHRHPGVRHGPRN